jgi:putative component of membrane protein insertase Oxa1/YidC/SpoIIIJ protein YidD
MNIFKLLAIRAINYYQLNLSNKKGFSCAYAAYHNDISCSNYGKKQIDENGLFIGIIRIIKRLKECKFASQKIKEKRMELKEKAKGSYQDSKKECQNMDTCEKVWFAEAVGEVACCAMFMFS